MQLTQASSNELKAIMEIVHQAQLFLASLGIDQWQNGYPDENVILNDIANNESFVVKNNENEIMGIAMFTTRTEPTYKIIEGNWLTSDDAKYGVIHRMAVADKFRSFGIAKFVFRQCEDYLKQNNISSMRIDTHQDNKGMQSLLQKSGYHYCGIIYLANGDKRLAFEKIII
ncbi:GNAT family N-acetyltransferase [Flavobacterium capsici]|uniref:GNAT family N-acetyltransferase n=1 Tax=Flavobacterium capsici TaxID=3075618 RepID=A0AA96F076_9FLAO|nr:MULTISPECIES: GNAT family N-acetyltransferase [unclassified Flavobacterium]WNM20354.1 GNAT family N-acetyltransferase [Flavobacterium sp. PMR2A8]WNM21744.1 GNAT family N-acetyltransferase [Flavobacterium sp. PMTSA4]